jgi:hypothetical protein
MVASDALSTTTSSFTLTVAPINDVPQISPLADRTISEDTSTGPIQFTSRLRPTSHDTTVVTLAVSDGTDTTTATFELTVTPVNDGPTISDVSDRRIGANRATEPIPFEVGDVDNDPARLTLTASSSNPALVGVSGIVFGGHGGNGGARLGACGPM